MKPDIIIEEVKPEINLAWFTPEGWEDSPMQSDVKTGKYRLRIRGVKAETGYSDRRLNVVRHTWLRGWSYTDNKPAMHTGELRGCEQFGLEAAKIIAQKWADYLVGRGEQAIAKRIEICPATGGAACGWKPTVLTAQDRADVKLIEMAFGGQFK